MDGLHVRIALTKGQFSKYILRKAREIGLLRGQPHILEYLATNDGCSQTEVCEAWDLDKSTVSGLIGTVIFLAFPKQLLGLFAASEEMLSIGVPALRIISVTFVFATMTIIFGYFASGLGNGVINMIGGAIRQLVVLVPIVWVFTNFFGISYTWYAMWISEVLAFVYSFTSIRKETMKKAGF